MRSAPPIEPGTPRRNARPSTPASAAAKVGRGRDRAESLAAEANHYAAHAAVAHDQVRADADRQDGNLARQLLHEIGEVVLVVRRIERLGGAADAEPGVRRERDVGGELAAQGRRQRAQLVDEAGAAAGHDGGAASQASRTRRPAAATAGP
jgi:hypothetical protein